MKGNGIPLTPASGPLPPRKDSFAGRLCGPGKRVAGHVLRLGYRRDDIVFDPNAAEGLELLDDRPVDMGGPRIRMPPGPPALVAFGVAHPSADVVHLQAQQVADAVREEYAGNAELQCALTRNFGQTDPLHDLAQAAMCGKVYVPVV